MTSIEQRVEDLFSHELPDTPARRAYRTAYRRFKLRVPSYAWGDLETVMQYKNLLRKSLRGPFGAMFIKLEEKCRENSVPCVAPESLNWNIETPFVLGKHIELLGMSISYPRLASLCWSDLTIKDGVLYLDKLPLGAEMEEAVESILKYFWGEDRPLDSAPLIALSRVLREYPLKEEMVEDLVNEANRTGQHMIESRYAYKIYPLMFQYRFSVPQMLEVFAALKRIVNLDDYPRRQAHKTLSEACKVLRWGDVVEFTRLLTFAEGGVYEAAKESLEEVAQRLVQKRTLLPRVAPGLALSDDLE